MKTSLRHTAKPQRRSPHYVNDRSRPKTPSSGEHPRRRFLGLAAGAAALPAVARIAKAQAYPSRPITIIVPFPAGGGTDVVARVLAERMRESLGRSIIVENISGADGSIGVGRAARARSDGYTINLGGSNTHVLNGALYSLPYDVVNDFEPISPLVTHPYVLFARQTMPANDLRELIDWLKANPNAASAAVDTAGIRLITAFFLKETGTRYFRRWLRTLATCRCPVSRPRLAS